MRWGNRNSDECYFYNDSMSDIALGFGRRSLMSSIESLIQKMTVMRTKSECAGPSCAEPMTPLSTSDINLEILKRKPDIRIVPSIKSLMGSASDLAGVSVPPDNLEDLHEEAHEHEDQEQEHKGKEAEGKEGNETLQ